MSHCDGCPFKGCEGCQYRGGIAAQGDWRAGVSVATAKMGAQLKRPPDRVNDSEGLARPIAQNNGRTCIS